MSRRYRSQFEANFARDLREREIASLYEQDVIQYIPKPRTYTPDFYICEGNFYVETKGRFFAADRTKHLLIKEQYPDIYNVVESISHLQADRRVEDIESRLSELREQEVELTKQNSLKELTTLHPDFLELKENDNFTQWLNEQPENISDGIYKNNTNAKWAARIIDLYKAEHNLQNKQTTKPNAAQAVTKTHRGSITTEGGKKIWSVSEIAKLKPQQFMKYEKEIDLARKEGRIQT